ncbi:MAG: hypothetical protein IBJ03_16910 [Gemmatimonadaceae bacterium]|nr:hypothetical protein [Gemmatimonadaceae bacterium]
MNRAMRSFLFALGVLVLGAMALCSPRSDVPTPVVQTPVPEATSDRPTASVTEAAPNARGSSTKGFRSVPHLADHFEKHGAEFGASSAAEYLALAQSLRDAPRGNDVLEIVRPTDGVISRFDRSSGAFLAVDPDGTIRTFFKPNDGEAYFRRQAKRLPRNDGARP